MRRAIPILVFVLLCDTAARAQEEAQRTSGTLATQTIALLVTSAAPLAGNSYTLSQGDRLSLSQYLGGYLFGATGLGFGIWGATQLSGSSGFDKAAVGISLALGAANLAVTLYASLKRKREVSRGAPIGSVMMGYGLGAGSLLYGISELADRAGDRRVGGAAAALGALNLGLSVYQTVKLVRAGSPGGVQVVPVTGLSASGRLFAGIGLRLSGF